MSGLCGKHGEGGKSAGRVKLFSLAFSFSFPYCMGVLLPPSLALGGRRISYVIADRLRAGSWLSFPLSALLCHISLGDDGLDLSRELNK